jgi:hypothetical protein
MRGSWSGIAKSCFCVSPFLLLRRDSSSKPEQNPGEKTEAKLSGRPFKGAKPFHYRWDQQENPRALRLQSRADFSTSTKSHENKAYFKEQTHLDAVPSAFRIPISKLAC